MNGKTIDGGPIIGNLATGDRTTPAKAKTVDGWHFLRADGCLRDGTGPVQTGETYRLPRGQRPRLCVQGFHASRKALDALGYAPGSLVCRVEVGDGIVEDANKLAGRWRRVLAGPRDASRVLREFALDCAERAMRIVEEKTGRKPDPRSVRAIEVARRHIRGEATDAELREARDAATAAATDADAATDAATAAAYAATATATATAATAAAAAAAAAYAATAAYAYAYAAYAAYAAGGGVGERERQNAELERRLTALLAETQQEAE